MLAERRVMSKYFLAIDIGASSGRHILGSYENGKIILEEIHRFANGMDEEDGTLCWNVDRLFNEIVAGMKKCKELGKVPESVGIDTWGVDFVLLDENDELIGKAVGYRDHRTDNIDTEVYKIIPEDKLYERTGILKATFNTVYQLAALKKEHSEELLKAKTLLTMPDYFHFKLSGKKVTEYSEATTTQLINPYTRGWDYELINSLGFPKEIFKEIVMPGSCVGNLRDEVRELVGFDCKVVLPLSHDTASAVMAVPSRSDDVCYISSGTWSLIGVLKDTPDCSEKSRKANFTNEGGYDGKITYLTNIMGLWMIQSVRHELVPDMDYGTLCEMASRETIDTMVDCRDVSFLSPKSMVGAIDEYCKKTGQQVPKTAAEYACVIYNSLAKCYADSLKQIEELTGMKYDRIHVIGGGSKADYLNRLTAKYTKIPVYAGPSEATAIGNVLAQMIEAKVFETVAVARACVEDSFDVEVYNP